MSGNVVSLWRHRRSRMTTTSKPPPAPAPLPIAGIEAVFYQRGGIHEGVCILRLVEALTEAGMTLSNVAGVGLVIHRIGEDPTRPSAPNAN